MKPIVLTLASLLLAGCAFDGPSDATVPAFLRMYNETAQRLHVVAAEANWQAATDAAPENVGRRIGAETALATFAGSPYVIKTSQRLLDSRASLTDLEFRQLDKILLLAAEAPGTVPGVVSDRIAAEARLDAALETFPYCLEKGRESCAKPVNLSGIEAILSASADLHERRRAWEALKQAGTVLKPKLAEVRDLRNRVARELGYSSYFHLQVADYGMTVDELMRLLDEILRDTRPLYQQAHRYAAKRLAGRYGAAIPEKIPAHWLPDGWEWRGLAPAADNDPLLAGKSAEWIVRQAEQFYISMGMDPLPETFWENSDLYAVPVGSGRRKNLESRSWHIDRDRDVRSLMRIAPSFRWFRASHEELGHVYYFLACSDEDVPVVLREGLNRGFHEAIGYLAGMSARREPYLQAIGLMGGGGRREPMELLLAEALEGAVVQLTWSAGVAAQFEYELYEQELPAGEWNRRWWQLVEKYQGVAPPAPRGEEFCDPCTDIGIVEDPAQSYDYALGRLIQYQLHDYISREILEEDPRQAGYYEEESVGDWLLDLMELGATRDWREVLKEKTGEELSSRALIEYFRPLAAYLSQRDLSPGDGR